MITMLTSQARVLAKIYQHPDWTTRSIAISVDITERQVGVILRELQSHDYIKTAPVGRGAVRTVLHPSLAEAIIVLEDRLHD